MDDRRFGQNRSAGVGRRDQSRIACVGRRGQSTSIDGQRWKTVGSISCEPKMHAGGHGRTRSLSAPMHRFPKFRARMGRGGRVCPFVSPLWSVRGLSVHPRGPKQPSQDRMGWLAGDALIDMLPLRRSPLREREGEGYSGERETWREGGRV
jgi:hypothetical protein